MCATARAARGTRSMSARSPKTSPGARRASSTRPPVSTRLSMWTSPAVEQEDRVARAAFLVHDRARRNLADGERGGELREARLRQVTEEPTALSWSTPARPST